MEFKERYYSESASIYSYAENKNIEKIEVHISTDGRRNRNVVGKVYHVTVLPEEYNEVLGKATEINVRKRMERDKLKADLDNELPPEVIEAMEYINKNNEEMKNEKRQRKERKRDLKNKPSNKKWIGKAAAILAAIAAVAVIANEVTKNNETVQNPNTPTTNYTETYETTRAPDRIDTISEVKEDFVNDYLDAYNKVYGTNYKSGEMKVTALKADAVYELKDGRKVTRGALPYETEKILNNIGEFDIARINSEVAQILVNGRTLGTYNISNGEFIYSGNQLSDLTDKEFEEPTLEKLGISKEKLDAAARVDLAKNGVENKESVDQRIARYNTLDEERG